MSIEYSYEIVSVDVQARCMEIVYSAAGYPVMHIGARIPYEGETVEDIVMMYSPIAYWEEQTRPLAPPAVGAAGVISPPQEVVPVVEGSIPSVTI